MNKDSSILLKIGEKVIPLTAGQFAVIWKVYEWLNDPEGIMFGELRIKKENKFYEVQPALTYRIDKDK